MAQDSTRIYVPLGGNAWVESADTEKIGESGLTHWQSQKARITSYVRLAKSGKVKVFLDGEMTEGSTIKTTIGRKTITQTFDQADISTPYLGEWQIDRAGYLKIELSDLKKQAEAFGQVRGLILEGSAVDDSAAFVRNNEGNYFYWGRRGPSVHLNYHTDPLAEIEWFYNEVTVPEGQDVLGSYFMANGFAEGYFGMQVNSDTERRVLFSVWSPFKTDDPKSIPESQRITLLKRGKGVYAGEFGNEGAGGQSYLKYSWRAGQTYRFLLRGQPSGDSTTTYTAYFFAPEAGDWQLIASFKRPKTSTHLKRLHSFLENFLPETGNVSRRVYFGNQWVYTTSGGWTSLTKAKFTADATARKGYRLDYSGGVENGQFYLKNCGFFDEHTTIGQEFQIKSHDNQRPGIDFSNLPSH
ncbi:hypothetical protein GCM10007390_28630 [Persicitalea jodogahamensis]|uniref:DUF5077 domain-containing protein n=1 Tax=Persicitalea jodogahamensis TaxID=402147 RepID=A0A8J3G9H8_9BACT|nr:hypothetical protein GCM10007390_28630 [Persicitalea jodogahamensis]